MTIYEPGTNDEVVELTKSLDSVWDRARVASTLKETNEGRSLIRRIRTEVLDDPTDSLDLRSLAAHLSLNLGEINSAQEQARTVVKPGAIKHPDFRTWQEWSTAVTSYIAGYISATKLENFAGQQVSWRCHALLTNARTQLAEGDTSGALETLQWAVEIPLPWIFHFQHSDGLRKRLLVLRTSGGPKPAP